MMTHEQGDLTTRQAAAQAAEPESLEVILDRLMPRAAARRAEEAKAAVGDFLTGQRKKLSPPPRKPQAGLFPRTDDLTPRMTTTTKTDGPTAGESGKV